MTILTSRHSKLSAIALGEALDCPVYNVYQQTFYRMGEVGTWKYNMGCSTAPRENRINHPIDVMACVDKRDTFWKLNSHGVLVVPWTQSKEQAQAWLDEDRIVVNRATTTGKANAGLSYSYKGIEGIEDKPLSPDAVMWTRYVNHKRELRAYVFKGQQPLVFEKVETDGRWLFKPIKTPERLKDQLVKAQQAFSGLVFSAYDILEAVTGDFYFLENNSAPSLLVNNKIIPRLVEVIKGEVDALSRL